MKPTEQDRQFALFILARSGKQQLLQPILNRCEQDGISVKKHFEEGLVKQYGYTLDDASAKVEEWYKEYLASLPAEKPKAKAPFVNEPPPQSTSSTQSAFKTNKPPGMVKAVKVPTPPVPKPSPPPKTVAVKEPRTRGGNRFWWWLVPVVLLSAAAAYYFLVVLKEKARPSATTLYVLTEDSLTLRENTNCDKTKNRKIAGLEYNQAVELAEPIDSSRNWIKVRVPGKTINGQPLEGYIADYRLLGPKTLNQSLDSIYRIYSWDRRAEKVSYPVKKSLYQYIRNTGFTWCVDPVPEKDTSGFQSIADIPLGREMLNHCEITTYTKYRLVMLTNRSTGYKKALIFSLTNNYVSEKIGEMDLSDLVDPIILKTRDRKGSTFIYIIENKDKNAKKYQVDKNSAGAPVLVQYVAPPSFDPSGIFNIDNYNLQDTLRSPADY